jgi:hypothetical protein
MNCVVAWRSVKKAWYPTWADPQPAPAEGELEADFLARPLMMVHMWAVQSIRTLALKISLTKILQPSKFLSPTLAHHMCFVNSDWANHQADIAN